MILLSVLVQLKCSMITRIEAVLSADSAFFSVSIQLKLSPSWFTSVMRRR